MPTASPALRKRTQIAKANRTMFAYIIGVSIIFGFASVASYFLVNALLYNERVLSAKSETIDTLKQNATNFDALQENIRVLNTNEALKSVVSSSDDSPIQAVLDALPSDANYEALGASLESVLIGGVEGVEIYALTPDIEAVDTNTRVVNAASDSGANGEITFSFTIYGSKDQLKQVLSNLEKSIRAIDITLLKYESQGSKSMLTGQARVFYEPEKVLELTEKVVK